MTAARRCDKYFYGCAPLALFGGGEAFVRRSPYSLPLPRRSLLCARAHAPAGRMRLTHCQVWVVPDDEVSCSLCSVESITSATRSWDGLRLERFAIVSNVQRRFTTSSYNELSRVEQADGMMGQQNMQYWVDTTKMGRNIPIPHIAIISVGYRCIMHTCSSSLATAALLATTCG